MNLPNWFKIAWWIFLTLLLGFILCFRIDQIISGEAVIFDIILFLVFTSLLLVPLFKEIDLFGMVSLKAEVEDLKTSIKIKLGEIKNEIKLNQSQVVNHTIHNTPPPPDSMLPQLKSQIDKLVKNQPKVVEEPTTNYHTGVPRDNIELFKVRFNIENQIHRIWSGRYESNEHFGEHRRFSLTRLMKDLSDAEIIDSNLTHVLREILSICNYAIHGESISSNQVTFVKDNASEVIDYLNSLR